VRVLTAAGSIAAKVVKAVVTAANVADVTKTAELLHGQAQQVHADAGYTGVEKRAEIVALERQIDFMNSSAGRGLDLIFFIRMACVFESLKREKTQMGIMF